MAAPYIPCDQSKTIPSEIKRNLKKLAEAAAGLRRAFDAMSAQADGAKDQAADFDLLASQGGYTAGDYSDANTAAKASYDQINSVVGNYEANVEAAANQALAYHGWS